MTTHQFQIPRSIVARIGVEEYVRSFWWMILPIPLFGLLALLFGKGLLQPIGMVALLWPLTLAARSWMVTSKAGKLYEKGVRVSADGEALFFHAIEGPGVRLRYESLRSIGRKHGFLILRLRKPGFLLIPEAAVIPKESLEEAFSDLSEKVRASVPG